MDEDFVVQPEEGPQENSITDFEGVPNRFHNFCLLCKYGSTDGIETDSHVNGPIKTLERCIATSRPQLSRTKLVQITKYAYEEFVKDDPAFSEDPEWDEETIEEHLFVHEAGLTNTRGQTIANYVLEDLLLATKHAFTHMYNKETGMPDPVMTKHAMG